MTQYIVGLRIVALFAFLEPLRCAYVTPMNRARYHKPNVTLEIFSNSVVPSRSPGLPLPMKLSARHSRPWNFK